MALALGEALRKLVATPGTRLDPDTYHRLHRAGLVTLDGNTFRLRCALYERLVR